MPPRATTRRSSLDIPPAFLADVPPSDFEASVVGFAVALEQLRDKGEPALEPIDRLEDATELALRLRGVEHVGRFGLKPARLREEIVCPRHLREGLRRYEGHRKMRLGVAPD